MEFRPCVRSLLNLVQQCHAVHNKYLTLKFLLLLMEFRLSILLKDLEINRYVLYKVVIHLNKKEQIKCTFLL